MANVCEFVPVCVCWLLDLSHEHNTPVVLA